MTCLNKTLNIKNCYLYFFVLLVIVFFFCFSVDSEQISDIVVTLSPLPSFTIFSTSFSNDALVSSYNSSYFSTLFRKFGLDSSFYPGDCYKPVTRFMPNPPTSITLKSQHAWPRLQFSDFSWLSPALVEPSGRGSTDCYSSFYRWPDQWARCLIYASAQKEGLLGLPRGSQLPFIVHNGLVAHAVSTCDTPTFSVQETLEAQAWIHAAQHPADCASAQIGLDEYFNSGMGSSIFGTANSFMLALVRGHVWLPIGSWSWGHCPLGTMECFFKPVSNCAAPVKGLNAIDNVRYHSASSIHPLTHNRVLAVPLRWQHKGFLWWRAQVITYMLRPNLNTTIALTAAAKLVFPKGLPRPFASVFMRHGDKAPESPVFLGDKYLQMLELPNKQLQLKAVFMSSDTQEVLDDALHTFNNAGFPAFAAPRNRGSSGNSSLPMKSFTGSFALDLLLDLFLLASADVTVGISTSNWVRLVDSLRLGLGHGSQLLPLLDPFGIPYMEW